MYLRRTAPFAGSFLCVYYITVWDIWARQQVWYARFGFEKCQKVKKVKKKPNADKLLAGKDALEALALDALATGCTETLSGSQTFINCERGLAGLYVGL